MFSPQCHNSGSYVHINFIITSAFSNSNLRLRIFDKYNPPFSAQEVKKKWFPFTLSLAIFLLASWARANQLKTRSRLAQDSTSRLSRDASKTRLERVLNESWVSLLGVRVAQVWSACQDVVYFVLHYYVSMPISLLSLKPWYSWFCTFFDHSRSTNRSPFPFLIPSPNCMLLFL